MHNSYVICGLSDDDYGGGVRRLTLVLSKIIETAFPNGKSCLTPSDDGATRVDTESQIQQQQIPHRL
ncbi:hypothetical protein EGR_03158 [Echinococcus granulosus]|uniref:Uncharacterized protein n=1 Tax=Echinococcus granulosus TaxID=6210 RepID=W6UK06_ECHGR|nr:hypothetical protein EGR_03158 [Echinococcus granulosus]EUB61885.1 hypothetical protein EGR_03158 [Echinococcus granulosus]